MRCSYCDTAYAFHDGKNMTIQDIFEEISRYKTKYVTITGGEPLAQKPCWSLMSRQDKGYNVSLETGGAISIEGVLIKEPKLFWILKHLTLEKVKIITKLTFQ